MILQEALSQHNIMVSRKLHDHVKVLAPHAKCFVFDEKASEAIGGFCRDCIDLIFEHRQFAKPPYNTTYIEYDGHALHRALSGREPEGWEDTSVGYLCHGQQIYCVAGKNKNVGSPALLWPVFYHLADRGERPMPSPFPIMDYGDKQPAAIKLALFLGRGFDIFVGGIDGRTAVTMDEAVEMIEGINDEVLGFAPETIAKFPKQAKGAIAKLAQNIYYSCEAYWGGTGKMTYSGSLNAIKESLGDVKKVIAGLLWLQSLPKTVQYSPVPAGARLYKGKRIALSAHHVVHIHMKGKKSIRQQYTAATRHRNSPRWHEVRGHWKHRGGLEVGCGHVWPAVPNELNQYICEKCTRKRYWCKPFERGDKDIGIVDKEYKLEI